MHASQVASLSQTLALRVVFQMRGHHPHRAKFGVLYGHHRAHARHAANVFVRRIRQRIVLHLQYGQLRRNQIAELLLACGSPLMYGGTKAERPAGQQVLQLLQLVLRTALQLGVVDSYLLQAQHIKRTHCLCGLHNTLWADDSVHSTAPLRIPCDQLHEKSFLEKIPT